MSDNSHTQEVASIHATIKKQIEHGRELAAAAQASRPETNPTQEAPPSAATPEEVKDGIIPYVVIRSLAQLDNIYEMRIFGWTIAKAQSVLKLYNKDLSAINIEHAMNLTRVTIPTRYLLQDTDNNYDAVKKGFSLASKTVTYEKDGRYYHLNIIAFPEVIKEGRHSLVSFVIHNQLWHALLDFSKGYRLFNLPTMLRLTSRYAIIAYLLISQQKEPKTYGIGRLRQLLGCNNNKSYERGSNFVNRVLEPARQQLNASAPYTFDYSITMEGRSHKMTEVIITPKPNANALQHHKGVEKTVMEMRCRLDKDVQEYVCQNFDMTHKNLEVIEQYIINLGDKERQMQRLSTIKEACIKKRVKNRAAYLTKSMKNEARRPTP